MLFEEATRMLKKGIPKGSIYPHPPKNKRINKRLFNVEACIVTLLLFMLVSAPVFGQGSNASLSGTIADSSGGVLPNANITATNTQTGVETRATSNASGLYTFPSLPPGTYSVTADAQGFQRKTMTDVRLNTSSQNNLPFVLAVAGTTTEVEVTATAESMILEAGASTGAVMQEEIVSQLPVFTGSALDLVQYMGGVVTPPATTLLNPLFDAANVTFAGVPASNINITRDGVSINEVRFDSGINSPNRINPDIVGEFRMVLSPVDAEMGRGAGQVQVTTRSGSNAFHGSATWNVQNTALDSNEWVNKNREQVNPPPWRNLNSYTLTASGPIIRNRTFFFASWDQTIAITKTSITTNVLTPCARKGIYRYLEGVTSSNADLAVPTLTYRDLAGFGEDGTILRAYQPTRRVVDYDGKILETYTYPESGTLTPTVPSYADDDQLHPGVRYGWNAGGLPGAALNEEGQLVYSGQTVTNPLRYESVLGPLSTADRATLASSVATDCGNYTVPASGTYANNGVNGTTGWDVYRQGYDRTPFVSGFTDMMPLPNDYSAGDGLNTAALRWTRRSNGDDTVYGTGDANRKSITIKIDHNVNAEHRLSGTYSYEMATSDDTGVQRTWPDGFGGSIDRRPQTFQITLTSTLRPTLLNELRVGLSRTRSYANNAVDSSKYGEKTREIMNSLLPTSGWENYNDLVLASAGSNFPGSYGSFFGGALTSTWGGVDPRWSVVENITWMKGAHSFKGGLEFRSSKSWQEDAGNSGFIGVVNVMPTINGGTIGGSSPYGHGATRLEPGDPAIMNGPLTGLYGNAWQGLSLYDITGDYTGRNLREYGSSTTLTNAYTLLTYLSGSVASIGQFFFSADAKNPRWNDPTVEKARVVDLRNRELHFFFKDDWKATRDLTLNLGFRWEYYGAPWENQGLAAGIEDQILGGYGISRNLSKWMSDWDTLNTAAYTNPNYAAVGTKQTYIGPGSAHSDIPVYKRDLNNWAPHVGFAWQLPWFGRGMTTMRGGYSISYTQIGNFTSFRTNLALAPGTTYDYTYSAANDTSYCPTYGGFLPEAYDASGNRINRDCYIDFSTVGQYLPLDMGKTGYYPIGDPRQQVTNVNRLSGITIYDPDVRNPYVQNINLSITRTLNNFLTLDVRYIGTLQRKQTGNLNLNTTNYFANGIFEELRKLRVGGYDMKSLNDFPVLNSGIIPYAGDPNGQTTASLYAVTVNQVLNDKLSGAEQVYYQQWENLAKGNFSSIASSLRTANFHSTLRNAGLRPTAGTAESSGQVLREGNAPHNLINTNPQYDSINITRNQGRSNYHSMQTQVTMRPVHGLNFQATWTWSRNLARGSVLDYREDSPYFWDTEYGLNRMHRLHTFNLYGTYELPFGANGFFFRDAHGAVKKAIEGWQLGFIGQLSTGTGMDLTGISTAWNTNRPIQVGRFDAKDVKMNWHENGTAQVADAHGTYFNKEYRWVNDPQCNDPGIVNQNSAFITSGTTAMAQLCGNAAMTIFGGGGAPLRALAEVVAYDENGRAVLNTVFQNAVPGQIGNVNGSYMVTGPGTWSLDVSMSKAVEFMEGKRLEFRMDASNIFNHPVPTFGDASNATYYGGRVVGTANPNASLNDGWGGLFPFGYTNSKAQHRTFQARLSLRF